MSVPDDRYPLDKYPYYRIHDWDQHQPPEARNGSAKFIRNWTSLIQNPKYFMLSAAARGVLHGLWLYQGGTGLRPPRGPDRVRSVLNLGRNRYITEHLVSLERRGFLIPCRTQRRGDKRRGEEIRNNPPPPSGSDVDSTAPKPTPRTPKSYSEPFLAFWSEYPSKVGKGAAWKAWQKAKLEKRASEMIRAVKLQATSDRWTKDDGQYVPNPATWINQGRWDDDLGGSEPRPTASRERIAELSRSIISGR